MTPNQEHELIQDVAALKTQFEAIPQIQKDVKEIHDVLVRQRGFIGGIVFLVSLLWAGIGAAWVWLRETG